MANIIKPKLQHVGGNVKIKNYSFNGNTSNTKDVKSMPQLTMVTNPFATNSDSPGFQTNPDKSGSKPINIQLVDVLTPQEGNVESLLSKYHIFDIITEPQEQIIHTIPGNEGVGILNSGDHQSYEEMLKSKPKWEQGIWMKHGKSVYGTGTDENGNYWKDIRGQKHYVDENGNDLTTQPQTNEKQKADEAKKAEEAKKAAEEQRKAEEAKKAAEEQRKAEEAKKKEAEEAQRQAEEAKKKEAEEAQRQAEEAKKKEAEEKKKAEEAKKKEQQSNQDNTVGNGKTTEIPDSVRQSGIIPNYTQNYNTRSWGYDQGKLAQAYKAAGSQTDGNIATINDRYLVAVSPRFGKVGDNIDIQLENGKVIHAVIADVKGNDATSSWGHELGGKVDVVEWEINGTSQAELSKTLRDKGWYGSEVTSITNTGSGHYF